MEVSLMANSRRWARAAVMGIAAATIGLGLAACGGGGGGGGPKIALLLPESKTTRYEAHDHPEFEAAVKSAWVYGCRGCSQRSMLSAISTSWPRYITAMR